MNCKDSLGWIFFVVLFYNGGDWLLVDVIFLRGFMNIKCGKLFNEFFFYLMCYFFLKFEDNNFF